MTVSKRNLLILALAFAAGAVVGSYTSIGAPVGGVCGVVLGFLWSCYDSYKNGPTAEDLLPADEKDE